MPNNNETVLERVAATGTWSIDAPINFFSHATYRRSDGTTTTLPVEVAGDQITGDLPRRPESR